MGTFLTTRKMDPALAARIASSVTGRRPRPGASTARVVALVRLGVVTAIIGIVCTVVVLRHRDRQDLETARTALLDAVRAQSASLRDEDRGFLTRAESWLIRFSSNRYEGDLIADELRAPKAIAAFATKPAVYVRGPIDAFANSLAIADSASTSTKDAFLLCFVERPESHTEKVLLAKVRAAYAGGSAMEQRTANVRRLHDAEVGLPLLLPPWAARVQNAEEPTELVKLKKQLERAPVDEAKRAVKAGLLVIALDEPGDGVGPTELDGERPHQVRIGIVDLTAGRVLLRIRKHVDPNWISSASRAQYASGLDGCALALDVHESLP